MYQPGLVLFFLFMIILVVRPESGMTYKLVAVGVVFRIDNPQRGDTPSCAEVVNDLYASV